MGIVIVLGSECCVVSPSDTGRPSDLNDRRCYWAYHHLALSTDPRWRPIQAGLVDLYQVDGSRTYPAKRHVNGVEKPQESHNKATHHKKTTSNLLKG